MWRALAVMVGLVVCGACGGEGGSAIAAGGGGAGSVGSGGSGPGGGCGAGFGGGGASSTGTGGGMQGCAHALAGVIRDFSDQHPDFEAELGTDKGIVESTLGPT